jgi:hypothetical protein
LVESSTSNKSMSHFSIFLSRSSKSYSSLERNLTLYPKSKIAWCDSFSTAISIFWIHTSLSLGGIIASLL